MGGGRWARVLVALLGVLLCVPSVGWAADAAEAISQVNRAVVSLYQQGRYAEALDKARAVLDQAERTLGPEHPHTLNSVNNLAALYESQGRYGEAEPLFKRVLEASERLLGPEHPNTLTSVNNLAGLYESQGRYGEAEPLYKRALEASERGLGPEHPDTLGSVNNLAFLYQKQGRYGEAEPLYRRTLEARERVLGPEHPSTLGSVNNLALLYQRQGRYGAAEPLYRRALEARERLLGPKHPDTLTSVNNLAGLYHSQGRYGEAEPLYRRALEASERGLGPEHPDTLGSVNNLAGLYHSQGRYGEAEQLYRRALEARERGLGPEHPDTLTSVNNLAGLYESQGRYGEAEPLYRRALETRERALGPEHPDTLTSINNLAVLYARLGRNSEAEPLYRRALEASDRMLGPNHPDTVRNVNNLAVSYVNQGRYDQAEPLYRLALEANERLLGAEHPATLTSVNNLAGLHFRRERYIEAELLYRRALETRERLLGPEHPKTIGTLANLAVLHCRTDRMDEALRFFTRADQALAQWIGTEVQTAQAAMTRRLVLQNMGILQDAGLTLSLIHPSPDTATFAADLVLRWKKRLALDDVVLNTLARESEDPAVLAAIDRVHEARRALSNATFDPRISGDDRIRLRDALDAADADLRRVSDRFRRFQTIREADTGDVQVALPHGSALVEYKFYRPYDFDKVDFSDDLNLLAVILRPEGPPIPVDLGDAEPIVQVQRQILAKRAGDEAEASLRAGDQALIAPLLPHLENVDTLFISPDGSLHALPFAALTDETGQRLVRRFAALRLVQTGRDLLALDDPATGQGLVAVGGVDFGPPPVVDAVAIHPANPADDAEFGDLNPATEEENQTTIRPITDQIKEFKPLPDSLEEIRWIAEAYEVFRGTEPPPFVLTGPHATETAIKALQAPPRVLHLATHGYFLADPDILKIEGRPLVRSGIALADANRALAGETGPDGENGVLVAVEALALNILGTELVVLSACKTGQGVLDYSEGLEGLPRALYLAGAKNILVALWPIDDRLTATFMGRFYETWLSHPGMSPAEALQRTQLRYITSPSSAERAPATWAPFVLYEG